MSEALENIENFRRQTLKDMLAEATEAQQLFFKRMYSHNDLTLPIDSVVDNMPDDKINWAIQQVERTLMGG